MTNRCSVCNLLPEKRAAIDDGLRAGIPLMRLTEVSGVSKSTLSRHWQHAKGAAGEMKPALMVPAPAPAPVPALPISPRAVPPSKEELLGRIEYLWAESLDGLQAAKQPISVHGRDGREMEIPGDLRARAAFIREARGLVELTGELSGALNGQPNINVAFVSVPGNQPPALPDGTGVTDAQIIDAEPEHARKEE